MPQSVLEMAKDLVMAQIEARQLSSENIQVALQQSYASLMALRAQEETGAISPLQATAASASLVDWKKSITRHTITCLECGASYKQLSRHLQGHGLNGRLYRAKYGIPQTQPLAARSVTAMRKTIAQRVRPWEKAPRYRQAQAGKATAAKKGTRKRTARAKG